MKEYKRSSNRLAPSLYTLAENWFCGVKRKMSPLTNKELINAGFQPAKRPRNYVEDMNGWMHDASLFLKITHLIVNGVAGNGKDLLIECYCQAFNIPLARFAFKQGTNPVDWIVRTAFEEGEKGGTETKEKMGDLLRACQGITIKRDFTNASEDVLNEAISDMKKNQYTVINDNGMLTITIPSVILFSDYDRAEPGQVEILRQALELGKEKLTNPITGEMFDILPGTRFYFTSNSGSDGDGGRGNITQMKDSSLLSRMGAIYAPAPTPKFERMVVQAEFPQFSQEQVKLLVDCNRAIRKVSEEQDMGIEITLRQALQWGNATQLVIDDLGISDFKKAMKHGFNLIKGHLMETHNRDALEGAIDPYLRSDVVDSETQNQNQDVCPIDL